LLDLCAVLFLLDFVFEFLAAGLPVGHFSLVFVFLLFRFLHGLEILFDFVDAHVAVIYHDLLLLFEFGDFTFELVLELVLRQLGVLLHELEFVFERYQDA